MIETIEEHSARSISLTACQDLPPRTLVRITHYDLEGLGFRDPQSFSVREFMKFHVTDQHEGFDRELLRCRFSSVKLPKILFRYRIFPLYRTINASDIVRSLQRRYTRLLRGL
jgi:hypothetical protein